jgi:Na+-driven multidrug efflux pump
MGTWPIPKLIMSMSLPIMASMMIQALYNVVDSIFVAQICEDALTAVSLAFPAQNLMIAVSTGTGVGINANLSRRLGEKNFERANKIANHAIFLAVLSYLAFAIFGIFFAETFFRMQTDIPDIVEYGTTYLRICTICSIGTFCAFK